MNSTPAGRDDRHLLVAEEHDVAGVAEDRRDVGGDEELVLAEADDDRRAVADGDDLVRIVGRNQHQREQARAGSSSARRTAFSSPSSCISRSTRCATISVSVSVTKRVAFLLELPLEIEVVLDDAVVDDDDLPGAVAVRVRVLLGRAAVRRPARVADPVVALERVARRGPLRAARVSRRCAAARWCRCGRRPRRPSRSRGYSSRRNPSIRIGTSFLPPMYPMIPHIGSVFSLQS